jgi:hypothetical protein
MKKLACVFALAAGSLALLVDADLTRKAGVVAVAALTLFYGFTTAPIRLPSWMRNRETRGVALVYLGVAATWTPPQFVISALLIACGTRMVLAGHGRRIEVMSRRSIPSGKGEIVLRGSGPLAPRS